MGETAIVALMRAGAGIAEVGKHHPPGQVREDERRLIAHVYLGATPREITL